MKQLLHNLSIYRRLLSVQIRSQMQYRVSFALDNGAAMLNLALFFLALALVMQRFGSVVGWTLGEIAFLWGMVEVGFRTMDIVFGGFDPSVFGRRVRRGTFDQLLLRPVNITLQIMGDDFSLTRIGRIVQGFVILALAMRVADIQWTAGKLLYLPLVIGGMITFFAGLYIIGATITFWTVESVEAMNILTYGGSEMMQYPMYIYPDLLRRFFTYIIPVILLNYGPALYFLDKPDPLGLPPLLRFVAPVVGFGVLLVALAFWRFGIRHYQSTGT
jgi:ABC-2 type transport system permease protein